MIWDDGKEATMKKVVRLALMMLVVAPVIHVAIALLLTVTKKIGGEYDMMLYILLIVAAFQPFVLPILERVQVSNYLRNQQSRMTPDQFFISVSTIKFAFVEAISLYGLVVYMLSGSLTNMLYFYIIALFWSGIYWPRRTKFEDFMQRIESHAANIIE